MYIYTSTPTDMQRHLTPPPDSTHKLHPSSHLDTFHPSLPTAGHVTQHSSLYMSHVISSTQFRKEQLHYLFNVSHEMRMTVKRVGSSDLLKVHTCTCLVP